MCKLLRLCVLQINVEHIRVHFLLLQELHLEAVPWFTENWIWEAPYVDSLGSHLVSEILWPAGLGK